MITRRLFWLALLPVAALIGLAWWWVGGAHYLPFAGVNGPVQATPIVGTPPPTPWQRYEAGGPQALAILLTAPQSSWLGLAHGLKSIGVPFIVTTDVAVARQHRVIAVYPSMTGASVPGPTLQALTDHLRGGGTLIGFVVEGVGMRSLFGFADTAPAASRSELRFNNEPLVAPLLEDPREARIRLGRIDQANGGIPVLAYTQPRQPPLAVFEDGSAAITQNRYPDPAPRGAPVGHAYAFGVDVGHFILRGHNGRAGEVGRGYANAYEPSIDVLLRLLKSIYQQGEPDAVTLYPTPDGKALSIVLSHDIDFTRSMVNAVDYAEQERGQQVDATYFIQTKYVRDFNDDVFFDEDNLRYLQRLDALGMEIASHTVAHFVLLAALPVGSGDERYPGYIPFVKSREVARNATVLGELRVSKFLLEHFTGKPVISFRPGHLSYPQALPQALVATGYRYSSSLTAGNALTHLPFQLMHDRAFDSEVDVFEFPITIEDEAGRLGDRVDAAITIGHQIARYGGFMAVLIHPDVLDHKLRFQQQFIAAFRQQAWFGSLRSFGDWWSARDRVAVSVIKDGARQRTIQLSAATPIADLTLELPPGWRYAGPADLARQQGQRLIVKRLDQSLALPMVQPLATRQ